MSRCCWLPRARRKVEDRVAAAELAELKPVVMDVEAYAMQAAYELVTKQLPRRGEGQIVALVDVGASAMKVTIMKDDQQLYSREQAFGGSELTDEIMRAYGMGPEEAESLKRSGTPPDNYEAEILHPFIENLAQEVARACSSSSPRRHITKCITSSLPAVRHWFPVWPSLSVSAPMSIPAGRSVCRHGDFAAHSRQAAWPPMRLP
jgi:cell division ATPase FtsA